MRKNVEDIEVGDRVTLNLPVLVRVVSVEDNPRKGEPHQPDKMLVFDPIGVIHDGHGQYQTIGSKVGLEVLEV